MPNIYLNNNGTWIPLPAIQGEKGDKGDKGDPGPQGAKGEKGDAGKDGKTPVKGTDYWTAADKQSIVDDVLSSIVNGEEETF